MTRAYASPPAAKQPASSQRKSEFEAEHVQPRAMGGGLAPVKAGGSSRESSAPSLAAARDVVQHPGHALDPGAAHFLGSRFGYDFGRVRVHTGAEASRSAEGLNARAYTLGQHIVFNRGEYQPGSGRGLELLAHELAHTVQQRGAAAADRVGGPDTSLEHDARVGAGAALRGEPVRLRRATALALQRAEFGTYVSTVGEAPYLDAAEAFYSKWKYPNVRRVATLQDVLANLDTATGPIDRFRLVSHGFGTSLEIGLIPELVTDPTPGVGQKETGLTSEQAFRTELVSGPSILSDSAYTDLVTVLQADAVTKPLLDTLGAAKTVPGVSSPLGILLRAMLETYYLNNVKLDTGGAPVFANRQVLDTYNRSRHDAYRNLVVTETAKADQAKVSSAIASLDAAIAGAMQRDNRKFGDLSADEAKSFADPFLDPTGKTKQLSSVLKAEIREGAGGPFLKRLRSVRSKITSATHIEVRGCTIGTSPTFMDQLRGFFGAPGALPSLSAPDLFQYFFKLSYQTITRNPADEADLLQQFGSSTTGLSAGYLNAELVRAKKVAIVVDETKLDEVATRYGVAVDTLKKLNPKVDPNKLEAGGILWLVPPATKVVDAGPFTTLGDFCLQNLGDEHIWPKIWALNPQITNPNQLKPADKITIPEPLAAFTELLGKLRGGQAEAVIRKDENKPTVYLDDAQKADALGKWLASQKWDPKGRPADALSKLYLKDFDAAVDNTYIEFLSRTFPNIEDPIFPDDPRYAGHIKNQP